MPETFDVVAERYERVHLRRGVKTPDESPLSVALQVQSSYGRVTAKKEVRSWRLSWEAGLYRHYYRLIQLFDMTFGGAVGMNWTPYGSGESASTVRFVGGLRTSRATSERYVMEITLEEML